MAPLAPLDVSALDPAVQEAIKTVVDARSSAEGSAALANVYAALFHNPPVAAAVAALGAELRFSGELPGDVRELVILRFAARRGYRYEIAHHAHIGESAGLGRDVIAAVVRGEVPVGLRQEQAAALAATDAVASGVSIPAGVQRALVEALGESGVVEIVVICGLYSIMGQVVVAFDVPVEDYLAPASADIESWLGPNAART